MIGAAEFADCEVGDLMSLSVEGSLVRFVLAVLADCLPFCPFQVNVGNQLGICIYLTGGYLSGEYGQVEG